MLPRFALGDQLLLHFCGGLALHESFGLRQEVGNENQVVLPQRVMGLRGRQEVTRDKLGALMDELVEGVLTVGSGLAPDDRSGGVIHPFIVLGDALAVAFHVHLLEVSREVGQILVVGQDSVALSAEEVVVPDTQQAHDNRDVLLEGDVPEMLVDLVGTTQ